MDEAAPGTDEQAVATASPLPWWPAVLTVVAISAWPFLTLMANNPGVPLDLGLLRGWWLAMLIPSLVVLLVAMLIGRRFGRWVGGMLGVLLWLMWSMQTALSLRDLAGVSLSNGPWWVVFAGVALAIVALPMRRVGMQGFVAVMAVALAGSALLPLALQATSSPSTGEVTAVPEAAGSPVANDGTDGDFVRRNNVWFIVLDGLAGNDFLRDEGGYDATPFEEALEADGFRIQHDARSNYPLTNLSISSTVSMDYTFTEFDEPTEGDFFLHMSGGNKWVELIRANGYSYAHAFPGFYIGSRCVGFEDVCFGDDSAVTETDTALGSLTIFGKWILNQSAQADVAVANDAANRATQILAADLPSPSYNFVHLLNPHPPILRNADCDVREVSLELGTWGDGPEYVDAVQCLHRQLTAAADMIVAADPDAIVVIQGDHGSRIGVDIDAPGGVTLEDELFFTIFSAIRLPDECAAIEIPDDLTPVNTLRIVRACLEDTEPDLLENRRFPIRRDRG